MKKTIWTVITLVLASQAAASDRIHFNARAKKAGMVDRMTNSRFEALRDGRIYWGSEEVADLSNVPMKQVAGTMSGFGLGALGGAGRETKPSLPVSCVDRVEFDGKSDWLTVVMKNGDVIRGTAESMNQTTLRLKDREKPIRMSAVREIVATEPPAEPAPE